MAFSEASMILLVSGLIALLLHFIFAAVQILWNAEPRAGWINGGLALLAVLSLSAVLIIDTFISPVTPGAVLFLALTGAAGLGLGSVLLLIERRKSAYSAQHSPSLLFLGVAVLIGVFSVFIPILPQQFWPEEELPPTLTVVMLAAMPSITPSPRPSMTPTALATATPTATPPPTLQPTATPTRERFSTRTPTPTPTIARFCGAVVDYNLNLRRERSVDADLIVVIPFNSIVAVGGRSANGEWWFIEYNDEWGWGMSNYITIEALCENAPTLE